MPQATQDLRDKWGLDPSKALECINANFLMNERGEITRKDYSHEPTEEELSAIDYLFQEWDYAYES